MADWSNLPEELLFLIAVRLFSVVELKRFRSICKSWRSSVPGDYAHFPNRPLFYVNQVPEISLSQWFSLVKIFLSRAAFFRVTLSSSPSQGWLIKSDADINSGKICLLEPLSRHPMTHSLTSVDLSDFTMSEIQESFALKTRGFIRVVLVKYKKGEAYHNRILGLDHYGEIKHRPWDRNKWRVLRKMADHKFSDIIVHKGLMYALDTRGIVWWINSRLEICMYGPPVDDNITYSLPGDKSFVECCGELYIVDRLCNRKAGFYSPNAETVGFKVYKFDEEIGQMMEVKSLGDKAFVLATDTGFSVLAHEYYGCLQNSIYFKDGKKELNVFKLDNGSGSSITTMSQFSQSCFQMFFPSFL